MKAFSIISWFLLLALLTSCNDQSTNQGLTQVQPIIQLCDNAIQQAETIQQSHTTRAIKTIDHLQSETATFLDHPDQARLSILQKSWVDAHMAFLGASFIEQHLDRQQIMEPAEPLMQRIDAWPIQPGFLDSLPDYPHSGIVNDLALPISVESLIQQNGITDPSEVSLGFHALAVLIFTKDITDFALSEDPVISRRRKVLSIISNILHKDTRQYLTLSAELNKDLVAKANNDPKSTLRQLSILLTNIQRRVLPLFAEASELVADTTLSHATWVTLQIEIDLLTELTGPGTELEKVFELLDNQTATNYQLTLDQARETLQTPEKQRLPRISLLCAALGHQLVDFSKLANQLSRNAI